MPWVPSDAQRHTKKARSSVAQRQWAHVADRVLQSTGDEARAVREANGAVKKRGIHRRMVDADASHGRHLSG
ncbi:MAG: hypothetical protein ACRD8A_12720 [Candidatus Acidiferrales bacterium]